jgi:hypothetical protein
MLREIDHYFMSREEPLRSALLALRQQIMEYDAEITEAWKYKMPFYCYKGKMFCYLWQDKKTRQPYLGIVEGKKIDHPGLVQDKRARMKIWMFDAKKDLPVKDLRALLKKTLVLYREK